MKNIRLRGSNDFKMAGNLIRNSNQSKALGGSCHAGQATVHGLENRGDIPSFTLPPTYLKKRSDHVPDHMVEKSIRLHMQQKEGPLPLDFKELDGSNAGSSFF